MKADSEPTTYTKIKFKMNHKPKKGVKTIKLLDKI